MNLTFLLMFALINSCIELEISAPSFPNIMQHFQVSEAMVGLTITYNLIGFCIAALVYGPLSEGYGRRHIMVIGNGILALGALGCVFAPTMEWLLAARFTQGVGAAASAVVVSAIIADVYKAEKAAKLYGLMNAVFTTLMAMAPVIGGFITAAIGWRGNYASVAIICVASWLLLLIFLKETKPTRDHISVSKILKDYHQLLTSSLFVIAAIVPSLLYGCYLAFVALAPFIYMKTFELTILSYTLHQGAIVTAFALTSALSGWISDKLGSKSTLALALTLATLGSGLMIVVNHPDLLTGSMSLVSIGSALLYPIVFARSLEIFPALKGTAASAIMGLRYLLCSMITGLVSYLYDGSVLMLALPIFGVVMLLCILVSQLIFRLRWD